MPNYTTKYQFPSPKPTEAADGPTGFQQLAQRVEDILFTQFGKPIPAGVIVMWSGAVSAIPAGWRLCDGGGGTPDLRGRFVVGASQDSGAANAGAAYNVANTGGEDKHVLTTAELATHTHVGNALPAHDHNIDPGGTHEHTGWARQIYDGSGNHWAASPSYGNGVSVDSSITAATGSHTHNADPTGAGTPSVQNTGSNTAHENRPRYYALAYIMKLA